MLILRRSIFAGLRGLHKRYVHAAVTCCGSNQVNRQGKLLGKFISASKKQGKFNPNDNMWGGTGAPTAAILDEARPIPGRKRRRTDLLNALFMQHVTDLMANGEISDELLGYSIEITRVKISIDYLFLTIYWMTVDYTHENIIEEKIKQCTGRLRHQLINLHLMGNVPTIVFVKDKEQKNKMEIERLLSVANYGEDFVPANPGLKLLDELVLKKELPEAVKLCSHDELLIEENQSDDEGEPSTPDVAPMRHTACGLNHADLMLQVKQEMKKARALHRQDPELTEPSMTSSESRTQPSHVLTTGDRIRELDKFFKERKKLRFALEKNSKNFSPEKPVLRAFEEDRRQGDYLDAGREDPRDYDEDFFEEENLIEDTTKDVK